MSFILSNAFKSVLLCSFVNVRFDLAVKSLDDLINKPKVEIYQHNIMNFISNDIKSPLIDKLKERITKSSYMKTSIISDDKQITKFQNGKAVLICNSYNCPQYQTVNPHLKLVYSDGDPQIHSFISLRVPKSHSHSFKIYKL